VNEFVEECRREWKRLRVPDAVANEMAADLAADLEEAKAEGASPEDVLGAAAFDARSFAASWAAARGVVPQSTPPRDRRPVLLAAIAILGAAVLAGGVIAAFAPSSRSVTAPAIRRPLLHPVQPKWVPIAPSLVHVESDGGHAVTIGLVLLIGGLAGIAVVAASSLWRERGRYAGFF
jgi:hypothetical protein